MLFSELHTALLVTRIDVSEHALYRTRQSNLETFFGNKLAYLFEHPHDHIYCYYVCCFNTSGDFSISRFGITIKNAWI